MPFSQPIKTEALVKSGRRCCVCAEFKGVFLEVHHIIPQAERGDDSLNNAIVLCFDCHAAAGHYNPKHPKGVKYSRKELTRQRDEHWKRIAEGKLKTSGVKLSANVHVRHIVCLDYGMALEILKGNWSANPFKFRAVAKTEIYELMIKTLSDNLPNIAPHNMLGSTWLGGTVYLGAWNTRDELVAKFPEFKTIDSRPVVVADFDNGSIKSSFLRKCGESVGWAELGSLDVQTVECGGENFYLEYFLRRPVFLFTEILNQSSSSIVVRGIRYLEPDDGEFVGSLSSSRLKQRESQLASFVINPGEALAVPQAVLLASSSHDDYEFEWSASRECDTAQIDFWGYRSGGTPQEYLVAGPANLINGFEVAIDGERLNIESHLIDMSKLYVVERAWMCGSCPYAVFLSATGAIISHFEILEDGWHNPTTSTFVAPAGSTRLAICEFQPEITLIDRIEINGVGAINRDTRLKQFEFLTLDTCEGDRVTIFGSYQSKIEFPEPGFGGRKKRSYVHAGLKSIQRN